MKYFFILGRNVELSVEEFKCYFGNSKNLNGFSIIGNIIFANFNKELPKDTINKLGGTIAIGKILIEGNIFELESKLEKEELYLGSKKNFTYLIWDFSNEETYEKISSFIKQSFKKEKLKATKKNLNNTLHLQSGEEIQIPNSVVDEEYFLFSDDGNNCFGRVIEKTNYKEIERRDMKKPVRRENLSISPRLSKIMINLSKVKEDQILVDPFCGIGALLIEALVQDINVIGLDKDSEAIEGARKNLEWGKFSRKKYTLINSNSSKSNISSSNVLVTEPDLGETLKRIPSNEKIGKILYGYEDLMIAVLNNLKGKISGKIVFTAPYILQQNNKRRGCNFERILKRTNLRLKRDFPIEETRKNQIVGRQIFVLER